jgi:hypothetical protein
VKERTNICPVFHKQKFFISQIFVFLFTAYIIFSVEDPVEMRQVLFLTVEGLTLRNL